MNQQAQELSQALQKILRRFGRQCRGQGKVFVTLVRETERHLLALGTPIETWSQQARACLHHDSGRSAAQRERLLRDLDATSAAHRHITTQSQRLTQGKKLAQCKIVNAYDPTIAPILKGKSNCPAQFGRKNAQLRQALHARGILTVGIPTSVEPINPTPSQQEVRDILNASGLHRIRTPHQVHLACASGYSRPVVEGHIATLMTRGADQVRYKGLEGAVIQMGMAVMAHNGAVLVRVGQQRLSKRGQKFRRLLGLKRYNMNQSNDQKN